MDHFFLFVLCKTLFTALVFLNIHIIIVLASKRTVSSSDPYFLGEHEAPTYRSRFMFLAIHG